MDNLYGLLAAAENGEGMTTAEILQNAGETILIGVVVVFSVLILLTIVFYLFGWIMDRISGKPKAPAKPATPVAAPAKAAPTAPAAPVKKAASAANAEDEVIAVIAAAIAAMGAAEGKRYAVKKVTRVRGDRPAWAMAGLAESTRPF